MLQRTTVLVTSGDIKDGSRNCCHRCPLAIALNRDVYPGWMVDEFRIFHFKTNQSIWLPAWLMQWIAYFDKTGTGEPFEWELEHLAYGGTDETLVGECSTS